MGADTKVNHLGDPRLRKARNDPILEGRGNHSPPSVASDECPLSSHLVGKPFKTRELQTSCFSSSRRRGFLEILQAGRLVFRRQT